MTHNLQLIGRRPKHPARMADHLAYSRSQAAQLMPIRDWDALTPDRHESLAAYRLRFREFQANLGKTMPAVAIEEEATTEPFGAVLAFMEKLDVPDSVEQRKLIREYRNAVNHEYEETPERVSEFFSLLIEETPVLMSHNQKLLASCHQAYPHLI